MITKRVENGLISIYPDGVIQVREDTIIEEDGVAISRTYNLAVFNPSTNADSIVDPSVKSVAKLVWTSEVVTAFAEKIANHADHT